MKYLNEDNYIIFIQALHMRYLPTEGGQEIDPQKT